MKRRFLDGKVKKTHFRWNYSLRIRRIPPGTRRWRCHRTSVTRAWDRFSFCWPFGVCLLPIVSLIRPYCFSWEWHVQFVWWGKGYCSVSIENRDIVVRGKYDGSTRCDWTRIPYRHGTWSCSSILYCDFLWPARCRTRTCSRWQIFGCRTPV